MPEIGLTSNATLDIRWGSDYHTQSFHHVRHSRNVGALKAPALIFLHGGGGSFNHAALPFIANGNMNALVHRLLGKTGTEDTYFDIVSVNLPQVRVAINDATFPYEVKDTLWSAHSQVTTLDPVSPRHTDTTTREGLFLGVQWFLIWFKSNAARFGIDPDRLVLAGPSLGGWRARVSQIMPPMVVTARMAQLSGNGLVEGVTSRVRGVVAQYGQPDCRRGPAYVRTAGGTATTYVLQPATMAPLMGCYTKPTLDQLPDSVFERLSFLDYLEKGRTEYLVPHYEYWERNGNAGGGTNGTTTYPLPDAAAHDEQQLFTLEAAAAAAGKDHMFRRCLIKPADTPDSAVGTYPNDTRTYMQVMCDDIYGWMRECTSSGPVRSGKGPVYWGATADTAVPVGYTG